MQTGTKIVLAVVVAVPVVYVAAVAGGLAPGLTVKCAYHGVKYCSVLSGFDECNLEVSVDSSTCTPSVDQPELHLCGSHRINWALVTGGYTYPDNVSSSSPRIREPSSTQTTTPRTSRGG